MRRTTSTKGRAMLAKAIDAALDGELEEAIALVARLIETGRSPVEERMGLYRLLVQWSAELGRFLDCRRYAAMAVDFGTSHFGPLDEDVLVARNSELYWMCEIGLDALAARRFPKLLEDVRASLGPRAPLVWAVRTNSAMPAKNAGDYRAAVEIYRGIVVDMAEHVDADELVSLTAHDNLAEALALSGEHDEAIVVYSSLRTRAEALWGSEDPRVIRIDSEIAASMNASGDEDGAARLWDETEERACRVLGPHHPRTVALRTLLIAVALERHEEARALELCRLLLADPPPQLEEFELRGYARLAEEIAQRIGE